MDEAIATLLWLWLQRVGAASEEACPYQESFPESVPQTVTAKCSACCRETNYIIHCAASIRFDEPISEIMRTNYASTEQLLELAATMPYLRCFTYMSTAYVNSNQPRHSRVEEKIYPLPGSKNPLAIAEMLLKLPPTLAEKKASPGSHTLRLVVHRPAL